MKPTGTPMRFPANLLVGACAAVLTFANVSIAAEGISATHQLVSSSELPDGTFESELEITLTNASYASYSDLVVTVTGTTYVVGPLVQPAEELHVPQLAANSSARLVAVVPNTRPIEISGPEQMVFLTAVGTNELGEPETFALAAAQEVP